MSTAERVQDIIKESGPKQVHSRRRAVGIVVVHSLSGPVLVACELRRVRSAGMFVAEDMAVPPDGDSP